MFACPRTILGTIGQTKQRRNMMERIKSGGAVEEMRDVILFIAMSLDGYIADKDGGVGWLSGQSVQGETKDVYSDFIKDVDTVIMGWNTYHQVVTELSPEELVYKGLQSYIITHMEVSPESDRIFTEKNP